MPMFVLSYIARMTALAVMICVTTLSGTIAEPVTLRVAALEIPLMSEKTGKGLFIDLLQEIDRRSDRVDFAIRVYPGSRAMQYFRDGKADMLMPFPVGNAILPGHLTAPFYVKRDFVFVRKGQTPPDNIHDLAGLTVGITRHYPYDPRLFGENAYRLLQHGSDTANMSMLSRGRIDAFIVEEISGLRARDLSGVTDVIHDPARPIFEAPTVLVLAPGEAGLWQAQHISNILNAMRLDGSYDKILRPGL